MRRWRGRGRSGFFRGSALRLTIPTPGPASPVITIQVLDQDSPSRDPSLLLTQNGHQLPLQVTGPGRYVARGLPPPTDPDEGLQLTRNGVPIPMQKTGPGHFTAQGQPGVQPSQAQPFMNQAVGYLPQAAQPSLNQAVGYLPQAAQPSLNQAVGCLPQAAQPSLNQAVGYLPQAAQPSLNQAVGYLPQAAQPSLNQAVGYLPQAAQPSLNQAVRYLPPAAQPSLNQAVGYLPQAAQPSLNQAVGYLPQAAQPSLNQAVRYLPPAAQPSLNQAVGYLPQAAQPSLNQAVRYLPPAAQSSLNQAVEYLPPAAQPPFFFQADWFPVQRQPLPMNQVGGYRMPWARPRCLWIRPPRAPVRTTRFEVPSGRSRHVMVYNVDDSLQEQQSPMQPARDSAQHQQNEPVQNLTDDELTQLQAESGRIISTLYSGRFGEVFVIKLEFESEPTHLTLPPVQQQPNGAARQPQPAGPQPSASQQPQGAAPQEGGAIAALPPPQPSAAAAFPAHLQAREGLEDVPQDLRVPSSSESSEDNPFAGGSPSRGQEAFQRNDDRGELSGPEDQDRGELSGPEDQDRGEFSGPGDRDRGEFSGPEDRDRGEFSGPEDRDRGEFSGPEDQDRDEFSHARQEDQNYDRDAEDEHDWSGSDWGDNFSGQPDSHQEQWSTATDRDEAPGPGQNPEAVSYPPHAGVSVQSGYGQNDQNRGEFSGYGHEDQNYDWDAEDELDWSASDWGDDFSGQPNWFQDQWSTASDRDEAPGPGENPEAVSCPPHAGVSVQSVADSVHGSQGDGSSLPAVPFSGGGAPLQNVDASSRGQGGSLELPGSGSGDRPGGAPQSHEAAVGGSGGAVAGPSRLQDIAAGSSLRVEANDFVPRGRFLVRAVPENPDPATEPRLDVCRAAVVARDFLSNDESSFSFSISSSSSVSYSVPDLISDEVWPGPQQQDSDGSPLWTKTVVMLRQRRCRRARQRLKALQLLRDGRDQQPNFIRHLILDFVPQPGIQCLVFDHHPRGSLADVLMRNKGTQMPDEIFANAFWDMAEALNFLYQRRIIHRFVCPASWLIDRPGHLQLSDFKTAFCFRPDCERQSLLHHYGAFGYIAPEIYRGCEYTYSADWFSMGVIGLEMLGNIDACKWEMGDRRGCDLDIIFSKSHLDHIRGEIVCWDIFNKRQPRNVMLWALLVDVCKVEEPENRPAPAAILNLADGIFRGPPDGLRRRPPFQILP